MHKIIDPQLYQLGEVTETWRRITAPVLHIEAVNSPALKAIAGGVSLTELKTRFAAFPDFREVLIANADHMLYYDQPERMAALIEESYLQC